jgi:hypothetical protein
MTVSVDRGIVKINVPKFCFRTLVLFLLPFTSCETSDGMDHDIVPKSFPINADSRQIFQLPNPTFIGELVYLETLDSAIISEVDKIWISKDGLHDFFIFDRKLKKIVLFSSKGKVKAVLNKRGFGPGEYNEMRDVFIDFGSRQIHILDYRRILTYDLDNFEFIEDKDLRNVPGDINFTRFIIINKVYYLWTDIPPFQRIESQSKNQKQQYHLVRLANNTEEFYVEHKYGAMNEIRFYPTGNDTVFLLSPIMGENDIQMITESGVFPKYEFPFTAKNVPQDILKEMFTLQQEFFNSDYFKLLTNFRETEKFLYFNYVGKEAKVFHALFDKQAEKFESFGRHEEYIPRIIYSDSIHFYSFISPDVLFTLIKNGFIDLSKNTLLGSVELEKLKMDDNPLIIKFSIE